MFWARHFCIGVCSVHGMMFSGIPGFHLLDAAALCSLLCDNLKCPQTLPNVPWGTESPELRASGLKETGEANAEDQRRKSQRSGVNSTFPREEFSLAETIPYDLNLLPLFLW